MAEPLFQPLARETSTRRRPIPTACLTVSTLGQAGLANGNVVQIGNPASALTLRSRVSLHSRLHRPFNRPIHTLAAREHPLVRVVAVVAILEDGERPATFPAQVLQPADGSDGARVVPVQVEEPAFEAWDITVTGLCQFLVEPGRCWAGELVQFKSKICVLALLLN
jgi:hypothetical protein